jgi:hypothetical protein
MKKLFWLFLLLASPSLAWGQGARVDNPGGPAQRVVQGFEAPIAGATIAVCTSAGTGTPCTPLVPTSPVTLCTDSTCSTAAPNPFTADANGNWGMWAVPGTYKVSVTGTGLTGYLLTVTLPIANPLAQQLVSTVATGTAPFSIASTSVVANLNAQFHNGLTAPGSAIVGITDTQTLTGKTIDCTLNTLAKNPCIVYSTASASTNTSIGATTMATASGSGNTYRFSSYFDQTVVGSGCTTSATIQINIIWTDPNVSSTTTKQVALDSFSVGGNNGSLGFVSTLPAVVMVRAKANTAVQYSAVFSPGGSCSPQPSYQVYPILEQLQ